MTKTVFLTGATGYIGGTVLHQVLQEPDKFSVTAFVRSEQSAALIRSLGASAIVGNYDKDLDKLTDAAKEFDIIIHTGESADHFESAKAILQGLQEREPSQPPAIYIHTSGTGVISDVAEGKTEGTKIYHDSDQADLDTIDKNQPHRKIDIYVRDASKKLEGKARTAIIIPPNIYGIGTGPVKRISQQTPFLIRFAIKHRFAPAVGEGINWWNNVHVKDLAKGYLVLLNELEHSESAWNGYWFAETGEHQWRDIYKEVGRVLYSRGLVDSAEPKNPGRELGYETDAEALGKKGYDAWGGNSRGAADRLHKLGWVGTEPGVVASIEGEVELILLE